MPENAFRIPLKTDRQWQSDRHNIWAEILQYRHKQETLEQQTEREQLNAKRREQREFLRRQVELKQAKQRAAKMAVRREFVALVLELPRVHHGSLFSTCQFGCCARRCQEV